MVESNKSVKIIFLGNSGVGKSSIIQRYIYDSFNKDYQATVGLDFLGKLITLNNEKVRLLLYDTAGQEKYRSLIPMYIRNSNVIIIVYDISNKQSFSKIDDWINETSDLDKSQSFYVILGNKSDLSEARQVTEEEGKQYSEEKGFIFGEVSAKTGDNIENIFTSKIIPKIQTHILHLNEENKESEQKEETNEIKENKTEETKIEEIEAVVNNPNTQQKDTKVKLNEKVPKTTKKGCCSSKKNK